MIRRPPRSTLSSSSAASDVYKRQEMACRLCLDEAFVPASENLLRLAQLSLSHSALAELVKREGSQAVAAIGQGTYGPNWTAGDCTDQTVITGADGVMVP